MHRASATSRQFYWSPPEAFLSIEAAHVSRPHPFLSDFVRTIRAYAGFPDKVERWRVGSRLAAMKDLDALFVDAGGVLLLPDLEFVGEVLQVESTAEERYAAWFHAFEKRDPNRDEIEWLWEAYALHVGVHADDVSKRLEALFEVGNPWALDRLTVPPGAIELLSAARNAGVPTVIVSNAEGTVDQMLANAGVCQVGEGPYVEVDAIIDSGIVGVEKPNPRIWDFAIEVVENKTGKKLDISRTLHVGDALWSDVRGAQAAGIPVAHLDPHGSCPESGDHDHVAALRELFES